MLGALGGSDAVIDPCPSCGGSGIDPELVEVLKPFMDVDPAIEPNEWVLAQAHQAKAAAAAVVAYWKEKG
jgi:hypothetical protein